MSCLICHKNPGSLGPLNLFQGSGAGSGDGGNEAISIDLSAIFVVRNILKMSSQFCEYLVFSNGNPSSWGLNFCSVCRRIIEEAQFISDRIRNLVLEFDGLSKKLKEVTLSSYDGSRARQSKRRSGKTKDAVDEEIRRWFYDESKGVDMKSKSENEYLVPKFLSAPTPQQTEISNLSFHDESNLEESEMDFDFFDENTESGGYEENQAVDVKPDFVEAGDKEYHFVNEVVPCPQNCGKEFESVLLAKVHVKRHHEGDPNPYECELCFSKFSRPCMLARHKSNSHGKGKVPCPQKCGKEFETVLLANVHAKRHHEGDRNPYECEICGAKFSRPVMLTKHKIKSHGEANVPCSEDNGSDNEDRVHSDDKLNVEELGKSGSEVISSYTTVTRTINCPNKCGKLFKTLFLANIHAKRHHEGELNPYECDLCSRKFDRPSVLEKHKSKAHGNGKFLCPKNCGKEFETLLLANVHAKRHHEGDPNPYECDICHSKFNRPSNLKKHRIKFHGEASNISGYDDTVSDTEAKGLSDNNSDADEETELNEDPSDFFKCPKNCGKFFQTLFLANVHVKQYHEKVPSPYECEICLSKFNRPSRLKAHISQFHGRADVSVPCPKKCGEAFETLFLANMHVKRHHDKNPYPYECEHCDAKYARPCRLERHILNKHRSKKTSIKRRRARKQSIKGVFKNIIIKNVTSQSEITTEMDTIDIDIHSEAEDAEVQETISKDNDAVVMIKSELPDGIFVSESDPVDFDELDSSVVSPDSPEWNPDSGDESSEDEEHDRKRQIKILDEDEKTDPKQKSGSFSKRHRALESKHHLRCEQCGRSFPEQYLLDAHILRKHYGEKTPFACDLCDKRYTIHARLLVHKSRSHRTKSTKTSNKDEESMTANLEAEEAHDNLDSAKVDNDGDKSNQPLETAKKVGGGSQEIRDLIDLIDETRKLVCEHEECTLRFKSKAQRDGHIKVKHLGIIKGYECPACDRGFQRYDTLYEHCQRHIQKTKFLRILKCTFTDCKKTFQSEYGRTVHINTFHFGKKKAHKCTVCSEEFRYSGSLNAHLRVAHPDHQSTISENPSQIESKPQTASSKTMPLIFKCSKCQLRFPSKLSVEAHLRRIHYGGAAKFTIPCKQCSEKFQTDTNLKIHVRKFHPTERKLPVCEECGKQFSSSSALTTHRRTHTKEKDFMCEICSQTFTLQRYLDYHQKSTHHSDLGLTPYKCNYCDRILNNPRSLQFHIQTIHTLEHRFKCTTCPFGTMFKSALVEHVRLHTGEKPIKCPHCPKTFPRKLYLNNHMRLHTGVKPWKCEDCQKEFSDKPTFRRHRETHGTTIHTCTVCDKQFKVWHSYRLHMKCHGKVLSVPRRPIETISKDVNSDLIEENEPSEESVELEEKLDEETQKDSTVPATTSESTSKDNALPFQNFINVPQFFTLVQPQVQSQSSSQGNELANFVRASVLFD